MLRDGLKERGFFEGQNLLIEYRWAEGNYELLPQMAADLVARQVRLILTAGAEPAALAARRATSATAAPFVFMINGDPVKLGLVNSIKRPGKRDRCFHGKRCYRAEAPAVITRVRAIGTPLRVLGESDSSGHNVCS
jgi:hypothetical protein